MSHHTPRSVFQDPTGRRWRILRRMAITAGVVTSLLALTVIGGVLLPPLLPGVDWTMAPVGPKRAPKLITTKAEREQDLARRQLRRYRDSLNVPPALRPSKLPLVKWSGGAKPKAAGEPIVAGFYVNWDDNSLVSLRAHAASMDWVIGEWAFVAPGGDSLLIKFDRKVPYVLSLLKADERPAMLLMISNAQDRVSFDQNRLSRLVSRESSRQRTVAQIVEVVTTYGLAGVTIDFENIPGGLEDDFFTFTGEVRAAMRRLNKLTTQALSPFESDEFIRRAGKENDHVIMMLYDEHAGVKDPGPVASQGWYVSKAEHAIALLPPRSAILGIGAFGYDWNDAGGPTRVDGRTFQDVMKAARKRPDAMHTDARSLNPYLAWTDADSIDHLTWYLDGVTAYNQIRAGSRLGALGHAIWRLGSEDPSIWNVLTEHGLTGPATGLAKILGGYDVEFDGDGELLRILAKPTDGERTVVVDDATGLVTSQTLVRAPSATVVERTGSAPAHPGGKRIALTFDDGPDGKWTNPILDTLESRGAPATFFVIGGNVERRPGIMRRIVREGHEFGNHTWSHPNLGLVAPFLVRLEIAANARLLEAILDRRTVFFRPPYFGDAEPTSADELIPVQIASDMGYITAGVHIDSEDWKNPAPTIITRNVLDERYRGNVVLLHDGGGDRTNTLAALGPMIDSLRARGDTLVLLSTLAGVPHDEAIFPLPPRSTAQRLIELGTFGAVGVVEWFVYWVFLVAVVLGTARIVVVLALAIVQRLRGAPRDVEYAPPVDVLVPAYNEALVVVRTVDSLLAQKYAGTLRVIVIDDGSPDNTFEVARQAFAHEARVEVLRKSNGGKASALNVGLAHSQAEIVVCLDADTLFEDETITCLVEPFVDPKVAAVAGNAKVGNRVNLVTRWQALEYVTSQNTDRRAFSLLDCITVVPGAVGAWRRTAVAEAGGFSDDTLAEDQDLTIALKRRGHRIGYAEDAIAWTEAPDTLRALAKQRFRWSFGTLQCAWKHKGALFRPRYGTLGFVALPNTWIFQLFFSALSPLADLLFVWSLIAVGIARWQHGNTYALETLENVMYYYALFLLVDWIGAVIAFVMEPGEDKALTLLIPLQRFAYRQVMYFVVVRSFAAAMRGGMVGWGKLERKASVELPV
jgi:cellulose synthase/poly-beta-1,6-N-acetylglucosamine synthase-like glycosyltransferase/peptidoglycan/xylan/chitin deacetylase (PgdA/CDA1 family)/spore germination protein YaaH